MTSHQDENHESHVQSSPEQSNVVHRVGNLNSGNRVADQNENPGLHVKSFPGQSDAQPEREAGANESATGGKKGRCLKVGKARGATISEPSRRITRSQAAILSKPSKTSAKAEKAVDVSEPSTSSAKVGKRSAKVGVTISGPSKNSEAADGKAGKKVEIIERNTTTPIQKPLATKEKSTAQDAISVYYIRFESFREEESRTPSQQCLLCEQDLSSPAPGAHKVQDDDEYFVQMNLPDVSFLACGHVFHSQCLDSITPKDQLTNPDPPCFFCSTSR